MLGNYNNSSVFLSIVLLFIATACNHVEEKKENLIISNEVKFNLKNVPFSTKGAGIALSYNKRNPGLGINDITGNGHFSNGGLFSVSVVKENDTLIPNATATPSLLSITQDKKLYAEACFESSKIFRLRGKKEFIVLNKLDRVVLDQISENSFQLTQKFVEGTSRYILTCLSGTMTFDKTSSAFEFSKSKSDNFEIIIEEVDDSWQSTLSNLTFNESVKLTQLNFNKWMSSMPKTIEKYQDSRELASYILWSSILDKGGNLKRPGMLMSKNHMHYIWSWDHCFNALACSYRMPETAWDEFMVLFDNQNENGQIPDLIGRGYKLWDFVKPPIHGWTLRKLIRNFDLSNDQIKEAYYVLSKHTNYWMNYRDNNNNGLPEIYHGNDSGWDNGSEYDINGEVKLFAARETPSIYAYLIIQMEVLSNLAELIGKNIEANEWLLKSEELLNKMISNNWDGERFFTVDIDNKTTSKGSRSLMAYLPIILGEKLPLSIRKKLVNDLKNGGYLTDWGLATEHPDSELYLSNGYWRGPIWAPPTIIIIDGLEQLGEHELAKNIALKYTDLCMKNGFSENFDALTGTGLRDVAYTWTASVFLVLAHEYTIGLN